METKDWILLLTPIVCDGILIFLFQNILNSKLDHLNKRNSLRDETLQLFWKKLQDLNNIFIQFNLNIMQNPNTLPDELKKIENAIFVLIQFYDTNQYDLSIFSKEFDKFKKSWEQFISTCEKMHNILTPQEKVKLRETLQVIKDNVLNLIKIVREKY